MSTDDSVEVVKQGYAAFGRGDIGALLALLAEDVDWRSPSVEGAGFGGALKGREAVARSFEALTAAEDIQEFVQQDYIAEGDRVAVTGRSKSVIRSTGRTLELDYVHLFTVGDGKIQRFVEYFDTAVASDAYRRTSAAGG